MSDYQEKWTQFQKHINDFIGKHPQSPLGRKERKKFTGLPHYEWIGAYVIEATSVDFPEDEPLIEMATSTGESVTYRPHTRLSFTIAGQSGELTVYKDPKVDDFFLPFKDATNGSDTYGSGRYLDSHRPCLWQEANGKWMIDFNYAYNPYCAYNQDYSCPLPPRENWLSIPILAGEKSFK